MASREEGPVYYREIQKNAYLKRIPTEPASKLRPLASKKPPLKPMWTLFCVHNGRIPYLEQYPSADSSPTLTHRPLWRACLTTARHVTASVKPHAGEEYDFLVDCDHGPVRMLAPDWDSMQDWVSTLRTKLHELKILSRGENVYCAPPLPPIPRAPARDPTSPLPPTPPVPVQRVPGIELTTQPSRINEPEQTQPEPENQTQNANPSEPQPLSEETIDISNWEYPETTNSEIISTETSMSIAQALPISGAGTKAIPSTSTEVRETKKESKETKTRVAKICGQNICLDDSILKRNTESTESDEEFFAEIDRIHESVENLHLDEISEGFSRDGYKQTLLVDGEKANTSQTHSDHQPTNITVIKVSNKPPHTAIPIMGNETNIFDFTFKQQLSVNLDKHVSNTTNCHATNHSNVHLTQTALLANSQASNSLSNVTHVNSQVTSHSNFNVNSQTSNISNCEVSSHSNVNVTNSQLNSQASNNSNYQASSHSSSQLSSNVSKHENFVNIVNTEVSVMDNQKENDYGTVFSREPEYGHISLTTTVSLTGDVKNDDVKVTDGIYEKLCLASTSSTQPSQIPVKNVRNYDKLRKSSLPNLDSNQDSTYEYLFPNTNTNVTLNSTESSILINGNSHTEISTENSRNTQKSTRNHTERTTNNDVARNNENSTNRQNCQAETRQNVQSQNTNSHTQNIRQNSSQSSQSQNLHANSQNVHANSQNQSNSRVERLHGVERSHSQNAFDRANGLRDRLIRRAQNSSPKREKTDKPENQNKPIWKRGLTELSLLSRLRGRPRRHESPHRDTNASDRPPCMSSPSAVVHRSRPEGRLDGSRRRSSSLNNGSSPPGALPVLCTLRARQAAGLKAEQRRGAVIPAAVPKRDPPIFVDYNRCVWIAWWGVGGARCGGRAGDRLAYIRGAVVTDAANARLRAKQSQTPLVDILFHRVPLGKIYVINKRDLESIGIKLDNECVITGIEPGSPAEAAGIPPPGRWALTEVNNRPINLIKGAEEEMNRLSLHGTEVSILIQPAALVKKIRSAIRNRTLFG